MVFYKLKCWLVRLPTSLTSTSAPVITLILEVEDFFVLFKATGAYFDMRKE